MDASSEQRILREMEQARLERRPLRLRPRGATELRPRDYGDAPTFEIERERVFRRAWTPVARETELLKPGAFVTTEIAGEPLIVVADERGELRALSNVCRHRGAVIVREQRGCLRELRCPFHGFTYALDGRVAAVPARESFDERASSLRLPCFTLERWGGWCWVRPAASGPALREDLGEELLAELSEWDFEQVELKRRWSAEGDFDWKIGVEAFLEPLHVASIHSRSVHPIVDFQAASFAEFGPHSRQAIAFRTANAFEVDGPLGSAAARAGVTAFARLKRVQRAANFAYLIFPATILNLLPNHFTLFRIEPLAPARTRLVCELYGAPASTPEAAEFFAALEPAYGQLFDEDLDNLAQVQRGARTRTLDGLTLSDYEQRIESFRLALARVCRD